MSETQVQPLGQEDPLEKGMATKAIFLSGDFHGQRNLVGCSPWGHKELDTTDRLLLSLLHHVMQGRAWLADQGCTQPPSRMKPGTALPSWGSKASPPYCWKSHLNVSGPTDDPPAASPHEHRGHHFTDFTLCVALETSWKRRLQWLTRRPLLNVASDEVWTEQPQLLCDAPSCWKAVVLQLQN